MCSIHLNDATAAIVRQNALHTPAYRWRGDSVMKSISVWGWLGGHDGQKTMGKYDQDAGVTPYSFSKDILGESGPLFNVQYEWYFYSIYYIYI